MVVAHETKKKTMSNQKAKRHKPDEHGNDSLVNPYQNSMISFDIPGDIVETIITFFPVKQAARSSLLASRFRNTLKYIKSLIFDKEFARGYHRGALVSIIDQIFRHHEGSKIKSFRLFIYPTESIIPTIESWIKQAIAKDVEEIELDFSSVSTIPVLSSDWVDSGITLTSLTINNCEFNPHLSELKNWHLLKNVVLKCVDVNIQFIGALFDCCILLENLEIIHCYSLNIVYINATKQKWLRVLKFGDCENLVDLEINAPSLKSFYYIGNPIYLKLNNVAKLEDFLLTMNSAKHLTQPFKLIGLVYDLSYLKVLSTTSIFLELNSFNFVRTTYWELHQKNELDRLVPNLYTIKFIKILGYKFDEHEIELVLFFLRKTINLENLVLVTPKKDALKIDVNRAYYYRRLFYFSRVSKQARILLYESSNDVETPRPMHTKTWFHSLWASK
ncbi:FBD-associated F-box protein At1g61320 [Carica papaya]|uniref:FBD-associated F-box protein At1g61320 n=1 Tax=Carica papaya TaxID=3649 RepID=UPI000B8C9024|nr:FBD-associated F-box protein At1g61320 [Carica papaya]